MSVVAEKDSPEYKKLQSDIVELKHEIQAAKERIYKHYLLKRQTEVILNESSDENSKSIPSPNLHLCFYNQIMQLKCKDESATILFPFNGILRFGFNLIKSSYGKWSLEKTYLPCTVDLEHLKNEISDLSLKEISSYIEQIHRNVNAYCNREDLVKQLKEIMVPTIRLYHCLRYTELEFTFKVLNTETKIRKSLTIQLNFDLLSLQPFEVTCKINGTEEDQEMKQFFEQHFKIFTEKDLISAYKEAFIDVDEYKFFV